MTTIVEKKPVCTLINVFTVKPERQQELLDVLTEATEEVIKHLPGFISANFHKSVDGVRVANYAQWENPGSITGNAQPSRSQSTHQEVPGDCRSSRFPPVYG